MENLKKLLTKCKRRGRPVFLALTTCLALTLLTIGVTNLYSYLSTQAATSTSGIRLKAFCYDTLGEFQSYVEDQWGAANGKKGKYGAEIDADGGYLQCSTYPYCNERKLSGMKLTTAKLKERCDESDKQSPRRYWFWMKARDHFGGSGNTDSAAASERGSLTNPFSTLAAPVQTLGVFSSTLTSLTSTQVAQAYTTWHTEYFYTSTNKLSQPFKAKSGENCVKVPMENLKEGGIIKSLGNTLSGNKSLDGYVVDIKPFYDKFMNNKLYNEYPDYIYLHTVVGVREPHKGDIITQRGWEAICGSWPNVNWEIPQSYNQWIQIDVTKEPVKLQVYAVKSENDVPTKEELEYERTNPNVLGRWEEAEAEKFSLVKFSHMGVWKSDDKEYALKGFTVERNYGTPEKPDWQGTKTFNISDNEFIAADDESKTTNDYGRMDNVINNKFESDYAAETVVTYYSTYSLDLKKGDESSITFDSGGSSLGVKHDGNMTQKNNAAISGKRTYDDLVNYMKNYALRVDIHDTRICLIYAEKPKAEVEVKVRPFNWSQSENKYVKAYFNHSKRRVLSDEGNVLLFWLIL